MANHTFRRAVYGITTALIFSALAIPAVASPMPLNVGEGQSAAISDQTFGLGLDLEALIITTVEQDQRSPYANKGICIADEYTSVLTKPSESSELVGKLYKDAGCEIVEIKDGWAKIESGSCKGFVPSEQLVTGVDAQEYALKNGVTELIVKAQDGAEISLYEQPSDGAKVIATIGDSQTVVVGDAADNGWTQVTIGSDQGYLYNASVVFDIKYDTAVPVEEEAEAAEEEPAEQEAEVVAEAAEETAPAEEIAPAEETEPAEAESTETEAETAVTADAEMAEEVTISDVDETVWATTAVYIRKEYSTDSDILGTLGEGFSIARTGIASNGWSRVDFDGTTAFIKSEFLTTEQPTVSGDTEINETIYTTTAVNIRQSASTGAEILGVADTGSKFTRTMESGAWSRIDYNGQEAYIKSEFLTTKAPQAETEPEPETPAPAADDSASVSVTECSDYVYATTAVNVRSGADTSYSWLGMLSAGDCVERTGTTDNGWSRVIYDGQTAYIKSDYLTTEEPAAPAQETTSAPSESTASTSSTYDLGVQIANFALQYVGYPYVYGGNSLTGGVDCSGFAQQVYLNFGYSITRTAQAQAGDGTPVSIDALQPGDLVFYADDDGSIGHVVIYAGNGQVVHASNPSSGIIVSDLYYRTPVWAVRII